MLLSIEKIFFNLKSSLFILFLCATFLGIQLINITHYSDRLAALKSQHTLIETIITQDLSDVKMATILLNDHIAKLSLVVKLSTKDALLDFFIPFTQEQTELSNALHTSSSAFQDAALFWLESTPRGRTTMHHQMMIARNAYLTDISHMIDFQIQRINQSIEIAKNTSMLLFFLGLFIFVFYRFRLNQIYRDINKACSVDIDGTKAEVSTQEINFIFKRLARKAPIANTSQSLLHPQSGLNNEKGMLTMYNAKKTAKTSTSLFIALFEIDQHSTLSKSLSKEDMGALYKKIGDIISMYEQPMDVIAHLENNQFIFIMSRNSKDSALSDAEKIVHSVFDSSFSTTKGPIKVTLSGGFLLKTPASALESSILDTHKVMEKAKESGGNRIAQLREKADQFR
ncbi:MAG: diguanylate cyclase [Sulfuricurvum sp.]|nr:diguanylate cyclase [Sulfuricurvum sp.]MDP3021712.1 diguanylate cyclase [Sulfuricurvum sp.]MDP3120083.1 diguanylate cyclase [Sulfuricurvum sp.]